MTREQIRQYLGWHNISYRQVAEALNVERDTVKKWFSARGMPARRLLELTTFIETDMRRRGEVDVVTVKAELDRYQYNRLHEEAERNGETEEEYAKEAILIRLGL